MEEAGKGDLYAINEVQAKFGSVVRHAEKVEALVDKAMAKLESYENLRREALREAQGSGALAPGLQARFDNAFRSMNGVREGLQKVLHVVYDTPGRGANAWHEVDKDELQHR